MRAPRPAARVPGFPDQPPAAPAPSSPSAALSPRAGTRQLNVRVPASLLRRRKQAIAELDEVGFETNLTEVIQALLHQADDAPDIRRAVWSWRRATESPPE